MTFGIFSRSVAKYCKASSSFSKYIAWILGNLLRRKAWILGIIGHFLDYTIEDTMDICCVKVIWWLVKF